MSSPDAGPLNGLRVAEFGFGLASALVGMVLADFGAEVVNVVPPADVQAAHGVTRPLAAIQWDRAKLTTVINLRDRAERNHAQDLVRDCDVVVDAFRPGILDRYGLGYSALRADRPRLIYCAIRGADEPSAESSRRASDASTLAASGRMLEMGRALGLGRPAYVPLRLASYAASQAALQGILAALHERERSGLGQLVQASLLRGVMAYDVGSWLAVQVSRAAAAAGRPSVTSDNEVALGRGAATPFMGYIPACAQDGKWLQFANWAPHLFWAQVEALGLGHLRHEPRFAGLPLTATEDAFASFWEQVLDQVLRRPAQQWIDHALANNRFGVDLYRAGSEGMDHPQVRHNRDVIEAPGDSPGPVLQLGPLADLSVTPAQPLRRIQAGQRRTRTTARAIGKLRSSAEKTAAAAGRSGPLQDVEVLDFGAWLAGPFGPSLLAELGARVIRVEPVTGDPMRQNPLLAVKTHQGKESLAIDLKSPHARPVVNRLINRADVIVENFRPGVARRLGLDYEAVSRINPDIVYVHAAGYGVDGPFAGLPAYHPTPGAVCGNALLQAGSGYPPATRRPDSEEVKAASYRLGLANEGHPDVVSAIAVATAAVLALVARDRHGCGQEVLTTMLRSNGYLMSEQWIRLGELEGSLPAVDEDLLGIDALHRLYQCKDGWIYLEAPSDRDWRRLCSTLDLGILAGDPRFARSEVRRHHDRELQSILAQRLVQEAADDWVERLSRADLICVRADRGTMAQIVDLDVSYRQQELRVDVVHPVFGQHWRYGRFVRLSRTEGPLGAGTRVGQHTNRILRELGCSEADIGVLSSAGVIVQAEL